MVYKLINKIIGDPNEKAIKKVLPQVKIINEIYSTYENQNLTEEQIKEKTEEFKKRIKEGETVDNLLPEAFALVKYACKKLVGKEWEVRGNMRKWEMIPFDVQLIGGIILHEGKIAEMKTGEGKTLVCTLPVYLNALTEKGVHVVTVNEYLAHRDAEWMGGLYKYLGLSVGITAHGQTHEEKQEAYSKDITYGTNNEFGFDYLRDNMAQSLEHMVQRRLNYAIVDEVDSILIDEARTPLIISAPAEESTNKYKKYASLVNFLRENEDYEVDEKMKTATLTEKGISNMEGKLGVENIYTDGGFQEVHHLEQALKAKTVYIRDIDYVVKDNEIIIVDEFTGRLMPGRRYSDGLHQAIEAKENVEIKRESKTLATITFQNYFRIYKKLAGMTGTAMTEAEEFLIIYGLDPISIPTNKEIKRKDNPDMIFKNQKGKYLGVVKRIKESYEKGQPALVGTISIEKSEVLSRLLSIEKIPHSVLNAKHHEQEAEIVAKAGQKSAVTIATNMAGRGTDIKLGEGVEALGGLLVIGTERHEARRIDNQLRGRSGRQGDNGESQFYVSMEDDLMRLFGSEKIKNMMDTLKVPDDMPIQNKMISNAIESAQKKVEGRNFDIRKHLVEYDDVMNKHREIMYARRRKALENENIKNDIILMIEKEAENIVIENTPDVLKSDQTEWKFKKIVEEVNQIHKDETKYINIESIYNLNSREEIIKYITDTLFSIYKEKEDSIIDPNIMRVIEKGVFLNVIDTLWMEHINNMSQLRESVALKGYGQRDPLIEYKEQAFITFSTLLNSIEKNIVSTLFKINIQQQLPERFIKSSTPKTFLTNTDEIDSITTSTSNPNTNNNPVIIKAEEKNTTQLHSVGRNEPCPCGSGKKYKKCCG